MESQLQSSAMAKLQFGVDTELPPDRVIAGVTDFSDRRLEIWPNISSRFYEVHEVAGMSAEVTEGSDDFRGIWARERYDWSRSGNVTATIVDSNIFQPGGRWEMAVEPRDGGSRVEINYHRQARGFKGHLIGALVTVLGRVKLRRDLERTMEILAGQGR